jgi:hypothetical protein
MSIEMELNEAIEKLKPFKQKIPVEALQVLRNNWDEAEPLLLAELDHCMEDPMRAEKSALFLYALYLCAEMRSEPAFARYVQLCRMPRFLQENLLGDVLCESMDEMLLRTCAGKLDILKQLVEDESLNEYARSMALEALTHLVTDGVFPREEAETYCIDLLSHKLEQRPSFVWNQVITMATTLRLHRASELINWVYSVGLVDSMFDSLESVQKALKNPETITHDPFAPTEKALYKYTRNWGDGSEWTEDPSERDLLAEPKKVLHQSRITQGKEPGRNDPCPCGSGKKYKKCCISIGLTETTHSKSDNQFLPKNKADEWVFAGYFYQQKHMPRKTMFCWSKAWKEALFVLPPESKDPDDDACDALFAGCDHFSAWLQDYLLFLEEYASWGIEMLSAGQLFVNEVLTRFPELEADFWADFERARIKFLLWTGKLGEAFARLEALKAESDYPVIWLDFESSLFGRNATKYNLKTDWHRSLHLLKAARDMELYKESKALFSKEIEEMESLLKEEQKDREMRMKAAGQ